MATKKNSSAPVPRREFQKQMTALKKAGLLPANVDVRKIQPTKHYRGLARKFEGVILGRDVSVKIPRGAKMGSSKVTRKGERAVVPRPSLNGKVRYDKKSGELIVTAKVRGARVTSVYRDYDRDALREMERKGVTFSVYIPRGGRYEVFRKYTIDELDAIFSEDGSFKNFSEWVEFVNVEYVEEDDTAEFDTSLPSSEKRVPVYKPKGRGKSKANKTGRN